MRVRHISIARRYTYERIAEAAHCAVSTVGEAIKALEAAGLMTWVNRLKRVRERCADLLGADGWRWRVMRTSNAYEFRDPGAADRPDLLNPKIGEEPQIKIFFSSMKPPLGGHPPSSGGRQCKSEGAQRQQQASGKTKPRKRTKTCALARRGRAH